MRMPLAAMLALPLFTACVDVPDTADSTPPPVDTNWVGEMRMTAGDTTIRLCGTGRIYRLSGPDLDTMAFRYRYASMNAGQWMKVWCQGHLGVIDNGRTTDSTLFAVDFQHLDASLHCDPVPDVRIAGHWMLEDVDPRHQRDIRIRLFADGAAIMRTDLHMGSPAIEEDGVWGMDAENRVNIHWPQRDQTMLFTWDGNVLNSSKGPGGRGLSLRRAQAATDRSGTFERTANWLASTASAHGRPTRPEEILPSTPLSMLFPSEEGMRAFRDQTRDSLNLERAGIAQRLETATTVGDVTRMIRIIGWR